MTLNLEKKKFLIYEVKQCYHYLNKYLVTVSRFRSYTIVSEVYSEPCQTPKIELFAKIVKHLPIFAKSSILDA